MRLYIEIFNILDDQAHGAITIAAGENLPVHIPITMPIQSLITAQDNNLLKSRSPFNAKVPRILETDLFYTYEELEQQ